MRSATSMAEALPSASAPVDGGRLRGVAGGLLSKGFWTALDQALVSGTNFAAGVALARLCAPVEYGAYAVGFITLMLLVGVQRALATDPLAVLGAGRAREDLRDYVASIWKGQAWGAALAALATAAVGAAMYALGANPATASAIAACGLCSVFFLGHDFRRRLLFVTLEPRAVAALDAVFCGLYLGGIALLWWWDVRLTAAAAFLLMAAASAVACLLGSYLTRPMRRPTGTTEHWGKNWEFGRWVLGDFLGSALIIQGAVYVVAGFGGAESAATFESARLVLAPLQILTIGGGAFLTPWAARQFAEAGAAGLLRRMRPVAAVWCAIFVLYPALVALTPGLWLELFYGGRYSDAASTLMLWAGVYAFLGLAQMPWIVIQTLKRPDLSMAVNLSIGVASLGLMVVLAQVSTVDGVVAGRAVSSALYLLVLAWLAARLLSRARLAEHGETK